MGKKSHKRPDFPRAKRNCGYQGKHFVHRDKQDKIQDPKHKNADFDWDRLYEELEYKQFEHKKSRPYGSDWWSAPLD